MKKSKQEKAVAKLARFITDRMGDRFKESVKSYHLNVPASIAFTFLADKLKTKRESYEKDFKKFCKTNGFTQYKVKDIEEGDIKNFDREVFRKYVNLLNMQTAVADWAKSYPNIAHKYNIT